MLALSMSEVVAKGPHSFVWPWSSSSNIFLMTFIPDSSNNSQWIVLLPSSFWDKSLKIFVFHGVTAITIMNTCTPGFFLSILQMVYLNNKLWLYQLQPLRLVHGGSTRWDCNIKWSTDRRLYLCGLLIIRLLVVCITEHCLLKLRWPLFHFWLPSLQVHHLATILCLCSNFLIICKVCYS